MKRRSSLDGPAMAELLRELGPGTDRVWLAGNAIGLGLTLLAAYVVPQHGVFLIYLAVMARCALYAGVGTLPRFSYYDRMLRLGLVAGVFEIFADAMLVRWLPTGGLVYLTRDAILLESPLYMPIAWACVIVEFGYVPVRLYGLLRQGGSTSPRRAGALSTSSGPERSRAYAPFDPQRGAPGEDPPGAARGRLVAGVAILAGAAVAGVSIGLYEFLAFRAGWWKYLPAQVMIGPYCAAYVPLGEAFMFAGILPMFAAMLGGADPRRRGAIVWGVLFAALIFLSYAVAYLALEGCCAQR